MNQPSRRRLPPSTALLLLPLCSLACGPVTPPPTTTPNPPQVTLLLEESNTVGKSLKFSISTSGCEQVQKLEVLDNETVLKQVPFTSSPVTVELLTSEMRFTQGVAATLALSARVTCGDGRVNTSQSQSSTFLPVEEVIEPSPTSTASVVPEYFVAEGSGSSAAFIGCTKTGSRSFLYRVERNNPYAPQSIELPFACEANTIITERKGGYRWVWTPGKGAIAIDSSFRRTGTADNASVEFDWLSVGPDGHAIVNDDLFIERISPTGEVLWKTDLGTVPGLIRGPGLVREGSPATLVFPVLQNLSGTYELKVVIFRYADHALVSAPLIDRLNAPPQVQFDPTGTVLYVTQQAESAASVKACSIGDKDLCRPGSSARLWISDDVNGTLVGIFPYSNGTRLAALTSNNFWFLDANRSSSNAGRIVNKDQKFLAPNGTLVARFVVPSRTDGAFYVFTGGTATTTNPNPAPVEIIATDEAEKGLVFRYQTPGSSLYGDLDDSGALWMRVGRRLVKPQPLTQYRKYRP